MDKAILVVLFCVGIVCAIPNEFGRFTAVQGSITVSRSNEVTSPIVASRVYAEDIIIVGEKSSATIRTPDALLTITQPTKLTIHNNQPQTEYGLYTITLIEDETTPKSLPTALGLTALYPGAGHFYIRDYAKAVPMSIATAYCVWNIFTINPGQSEMYHEQLYNQKQQFLQIYFVYWCIALLDIYSETNNYNQKITADDQLILNQELTF